MRILMCDDVEDIREMLAESLRRQGHVIEIAADGATALARIREGQLDAAILDIGLPDMEGYEIAREVRRNIALRGLRLIALTGYGRETDRSTALEAGFDVHLVKPVSVAVLLGALTDRS